MALFAVEPDVLIDESIAFMNENTNLTSTGSGSKFRSLLEILKRHIGAAYRTFDYNVAIGFIYGATGEYLDYLGDIFGVTRRKAMIAGADKDARIVKFYTYNKSFGDINGGEDIVIPKGTLITAKKSGSTVAFVTTEDATAPKGINEIFVSVTAAASGSDSNVQTGALSAHNFKGYRDFQNNSLLVINIQSVDGGQDDESDDNFRFRIINQKLSQAAGNQTAIRLAALGVPGVADVEILSKHFGIGNSAVLVKSTTPVVSQALLDRVQYEIDQVKADGIDVTAFAPKYLQMQFAISVTYAKGITQQETLNAKAAIKQTISDYVNNLDIGEAFIVNNLANQILASDSKIKSIGRPGKFFERVYVLRPVMGSSIKVEILGDYQPTRLEKLIISTDNPVDIK